MSDSLLEELGQPAMNCADCKHMRAHQAGIAQSEAAPMHMVDALTCLAAQPFQCSERKRMLETAKPMREPCPGFEVKP